MAEVTVAPKDPKYHCSRCKALTNRSLMLTKKILFQTMGKEGRWMKTRTVDWLCPRCVAHDSDWNEPAHRGRPQVGRHD